MSTSASVIWITSVSPSGQPSSPHLFGRVSSGTSIDVPPPYICSSQSIKADWFHLSGGMARKFPSLLPANPTRAIHRLWCRATQAIASAKAFAVAMGSPRIEPDSSTTTTMGPRAFGSKPR